MDQQQFEKVRAGQGFIAALDQSGGSTPKALKAYGIEADAYSDDAEMFDLIHQMRARIITSPAFGGDRVLGAILFEDTMDRQIEGRGTAEYLWLQKRVVPFLKVDKGLADEADGVQVMKPMPGLDEVLQRAVGKGIFGTKMRSVVKLADKAGIGAVLDQQFEVGRQILASGLMPILEPEIDITSPQKAEAEALLLDGAIKRLEDLGADQHVMFKLTLPEADGLLPGAGRPPTGAQGGGALGRLQPRETRNARLARNPGVIASSTDHPLRRRLRRRHAAHRRPLHLGERTVRQRPGDAARLPRRDPGPGRHARRRLRVPGPHRRPRHHHARATSPNVLVAMNPAALMADLHRWSRAAP
jgi:fructose-bisphosphate aldolase, class I